MIKICSLNFLTDKSFKSDVKTADGTVLFQSGDPITPELILRLYFKEIYVDEYLWENKTNLIVDAEDEPDYENNVIDTNLNVTEASFGKTNLSEDEERKLKVDSHGPRSIETTFINQEENSSHGPRSVDTVILDNDNLDEHGPRAVDTAFGQEEVDNSKGPKMVDSGTELSKKKTPYAVSDANDGSDVVTVEKNPDDEPMVFDENQAKKIVEYSLKLGKILEYSTAELKELEQVAYYCYIGVSNFTRAEAKKKGFRKNKIFASYQKLLEDANVPSNIAELVKFCAQPYESESYPLDAKVPCHHIVAITSFYEEMFEKTNSKEDTLLKMLQLGGNEFNIFILHKFINLMREG